MISKKKPLVSEPKVLITGVEGAGKTLLAVQQADLLANAEGAMVFQVNIRGADPGHLPALPFGLREMSEQKDPETGDLLPKWAVELPQGTVVIVDEAHKIYPQRGPGRPPKDIEMLGEARQKGIRFIYLSQSPDSIDSFLRERIHRHLHIERKGNMERAMVFEFDHYVFRPRTAWQERKDATAHMWAYPTEYYGWYKSASSHHFKMRIPWKIWLALLFIPLAGYMGYKVYHVVTGISDGVMPGQAAPKPSLGEAAKPEQVERGDDVVISAVDFEARFKPAVPHKPFSAPAFAGRDVVSEPEIYCASSGPGLDAQGVRKSESCSCISEQGTPIVLWLADCQVLAKEGVYNPFREPAENRREAAGREPREPAGRAVGVANTTPLVGTSQAPTGTGEFASVAAYGGIGVGNDAGGGTPR
jgi:hypothetical protein